MIRLATIGSNFIVDWFLTGLTMCEEISHTTVYSRTEEKGRAFGAKYGVTKIHTDLDALAADPEIDVVYIASPTACHCDQAMRMLRAGKHVICEKPAASNAREWRAMRALAEEKGLVLMEAMKNVYAPGYAILEELMGQIGPLRRATFQFCQYSSRYDNYKKGIIENAFRPELSNGAIMDIGCYCIHLMTRLFGMPERVLADGLLLSNGCDGAGTVLAHYPEMQATVIYSKITDNRVPSEIQGERGSILIDEVPHLRKLEVVWRDGRREEHLSPRLPVEKDRNNLVYEALAFQRFVHDRTGLDRFQQATEDALAVMDEARRQMGIHFPADDQAVE